MSLYFVLKTGPQSGYKFPLKEGLFIGRSKKSSLRLSDPKVSALHAKVERKGGEWFLIDNNSFNGVKRNGRRVQRLSLSPGVSFQVGESFIEVQEVGEDGFHFKGDEGQEISVFDFVDRESTSSFRLKRSEKTPDKVLLYYIKEKKALFPRSFKEAKDSSSLRLLRKTFKPLEPLQPLNPSFYLIIVKGPQAGIQWHVTYAPREVGRASVDLSLYDEKAPLRGFQILSSSPDKVQIKASSKEVLFNGDSFSSKTLQSGDLIDIGDTRIEVYFKGQSQRQ